MMFYEICVVGKNRNTSQTNAFNLVTSISSVIVSYGIIFLFHSPHKILASSEHFLYLLFTPIAPNSSSTYLLHGLLSQNFNITSSQKLFFCRGYCQHFYLCHTSQRFQGLYAEHDLLPAVILVFLSFFTFFFQVTSAPKYAPLIHDCI